MIRRSRLVDVVPPLLSRPLLSTTSDPCSNEAEVVCSAVRAWERKASARRCFKWSLSSLRKVWAAIWRAVNWGTSVHFMRRGMMGRTAGGTGEGG